jgi:hypothetical protein
VSFCTFYFGHCVACSWRKNTLIYIYCCLKHVDDLKQWYSIIILIFILYTPKKTNETCAKKIIYLLCCLFFSDIRILITPLVFSNSSCLSETVDVIIDIYLQYAISPRQKTFDL